MASNAIVALDVGDHTVWFNRIFSGTNQTVLVSGNWRSTGFGLPAAIAAKVAAPGRQVIALVGDGGMAQSLAEFSTAVRYRLPIIVVVVNNGYLTMEKDRMQQRVWPIKPPLTSPDFAGFGICVALATGWASDDLERFSRRQCNTAGRRWWMSDRRPVSPVARPGGKKAEMFQGLG